MKAKDQDPNLEGLPKDLLKFIFSFLSPTEKTKAAQSCKKLRIIADDDNLWKLDCAKAGLVKTPKINLTFKQLYREKLFTRTDVEYYTVGFPNISIEKEEFSNVYPNYREDIPKDEIEKSFPGPSGFSDERGKIKIFTELDHAKLFALSIAVRYSSGFGFKACAAVFKLKLPKVQPINWNTMKIEPQGGTIQRKKEGSISFFNSSFDPKLIISAVVVDYTNRPEVLFTKENHKDREFCLPDLLGLKTRHR